MSLTTFVAGLAYSSLSKTLKLSGAKSVARQQSADLERQLDDLKKAYERRTSSAGSVVAIPSAAYFATGTPCTGLKITQLDPATKLYIVTSYETVCVPKKIAPNGQDPALLKLHPDLACNQAQMPIFRVTAGGQPPIDYPNTLPGITMAVCFRVNATGVTIEASSAFQNGSDLVAAIGKTLLSSVDRSSGVQLLPP